MKLIVFLIASLVFELAQMPTKSQNCDNQATKYWTEKWQQLNNSSAILLDVAKQSKENVPSVLKCIKSGANIDIHDIVAGVQYYTPLQYAASLHHWQTVSMLVTNGANTNPVVPYGDEHYITPLMHCTIAGQLSLVKLLIRHGANVNGKGYHDLTALMLAAELGHKDIVRTLLRSGANVNAKSYFSHETALAFARRGSHKDIARILQNSR